MPGILDIKLTPKQQSLLDVLADPKYAKEDNKKKAQIADISEVYYYECLKLPNFVNALRLRGLADTLCLTVPIVKRMGLDALSGKYMQQKTMLEIGGLYQQQPLINVIINQDTHPQENIDEALISKIIDIQPVRESITKADIS